MARRRTRGRAPLHVKLLVDMNLSPRWVAVLAGAGIEAMHWSTLGAHDARDSAIMTYASANDYVVLTHDLDFSAILAATRGEKPSVVQIRAEDVSPDVKENDTPPRHALSVQRLAGNARPYEHRERRVQRAAQFPAARAPQPPSSP